mmetsp:Transcript_19248/g.16509  ORF Transcript_19248/g.16509 Transcript_19248/m.16509 type:complete len:98 (-) Transcript_19248:405-698(-)
MTECMHANCQCNYCIDQFFNFNQNTQNPCPRYNAPNVNVPNSYFNTQCPICMDEGEFMLKGANCSHFFCRECLYNWKVKALLQSKTPECPCCRANLD